MILFKESLLPYIVLILFVRTSSLHQTTQWNTKLFPARRDAVRIINSTHVCVCVWWYVCILYRGAYVTRVRVCVWWYVCILHRGAYVTRVRVCVWWYVCILYRGAYVTRVRVRVWWYVCILHRGAYVTRVCACVVVVDAPTKVQLGLFVNSFYSVSEQTMVRLLHSLTYFVIRQLFLLEIWGPKLQNGIICVILLIFKMSKIRHVCLVGTWAQSVNAVFYSQPVYSFTTRQVLNIYTVTRLICQSINQLIN